MTPGALAMGDIVRRGTAWYVRYKDADGVRRMRASHQPSKQLARRYLLEVEGRVARGVVGIPAPAPPALTVAALGERFLAEYRRPQIKDPGKYRKWAAVAIGRALPTLGELRCDALQPADLSRLRDALGRRCSPGSARLTITYLKTLFAWAKRLGLTPNNPFLGAETPHRQDAVEYLSAEEVRRLLATADRLAATGTVVDRVLRAAVHLVVRTGLRKGEMFGLRWRDVDLATGRLDIARSFATATKGNKVRHLRLPDEAVPILKEWMRECPRTPEGLVFPRLSSTNTWGMPQNSTYMLGLGELYEAAGCRPLPRAWHALRHTFASHYIMQGGSVLALQRILGHTDIKDTLVYAHLGPDFLGAEMSRVKF